MEYTCLKGTGLKVSRFCLGTMTFGDKANEQESIRMVDYCMANGVNFFDTADCYTGGSSEKILGKALEGKREDAVIATKVTNPRGMKPNQSGQGRKHIIDGLEQSLRFAMRAGALTAEWPEANNPSLAELAAEFSGACPRSL